MPPSPPPPTPPAKHEVTLDLTLQVPVEEVGAPNSPRQRRFKNEVRSAIARHLYISESRVVILFVRPGSVTVGVRIIDVEGDTYGESVTPGLMVNEPSASAAVALLQSQLSAGSMPIGSYTALRTAMLLPPPSNPPSTPPMAPPSPLPPFSPPGPTWVETYVTLTNIILVAMLVICCCCCCLACGAWARRKQRKAMRELEEKHRKEHEELELKRNMANIAKAEHSLHELEHQEKLAELTRQHEQERMQLEEQKATMTVLAEMQKKLLAARSSVFSPEGGVGSRTSTAAYNFSRKLKGFSGGRYSKAARGSRGSASRQNFAGVGAIQEEEPEADAMDDRIKALEQTVRDLEAQEKRLAERGEYAAAANVSKKAIEARMKLDKERDRIKRDAAPKVEDMSLAEVKAKERVEALEKDIARYKQEEEECVRSRDYARAGVVSSKVKDAETQLSSAREKVVQLEEARKKRDHQRRNSFSGLAADAPYLNQLKSTVADLEAKEQQLATNRDYMGAAAAHSEVLATRARLETEEQRLKADMLSSKKNERDSMADVMEAREKNGDVYVRSHGEMKMAEEGAVARRGNKERPERARRGTATSSTLHKAGDSMAASRLNAIRRTSGAEEDGAMTLREKIARRKMSTLAKSNDPVALDHQTKLAQRAAEKQAAALAATMSAKTREELSEAKHMQEEAVAYATVAKRRSQHEYQRAMCTSELHATPPVLAISISEEPEEPKEKPRSRMGRMSLFGSKAAKRDPSPVASGPRYSKVGDGSPRDDEGAGALQAEKNAMLMEQMGAGIGGDTLGPETTRMVAEANAAAIARSAGLGAETTRMLADAKTAEMSRNLTEASKAAAMDEALFAMLHEDSTRDSTRESSVARQRGLSA